MKSRGILCPVASFLALPSGNFSCTKNNRKMQHKRYNFTLGKQPPHAHAPGIGGRGAGTYVGLTLAMLFLGLGAAVPGHGTTNEDRETTAIRSISI